MFESETAAVRALIDRYNRCSLQAHTAYMQGRMEDAAQLYDRTFRIGTELVSRPPVTARAIRYCVEACLNCVEYGSCLAGQDCWHYLLATERLLADVIATEAHGREIRAEALSRWIEMREWLASASAGETVDEAEETLRRMNSLWEEYAKELLVTH